MTVVLGRNPCSVNFEDVQLKTSKPPWVCENVHVTGTTTPTMPVCPFGPNDTPAPPPPAPQPKHECTLTKLLGCFNDTASGSVLPKAQLQLHDIVRELCLGMLRRQAEHRRDRWRQPLLVRSVCGWCFGAGAASSGVPGKRLPWQPH